jgi:U3 small nucleolar RNA-associated protein MPP10
MYLLSKTIGEQKKSRSLPKLLTNGMDDESIWQQLEIQNGEIVQQSLQNISSFLAVPSDTFQLNMKEMAEQSQEVSDQDCSDDEDSEGDVEDNDESEVQSDEEQNSNEEADEEEDSEQELEDQPRTKKKFRKTIVDDTFFKLGEMEEFLTREERKGDNESDGDSDGINMFSTSVDTNLVESMMYHDFYDYPENFEGEEPEEGEEEPEEEEQVEEDEEDPNEPMSSCRND